MKWCVQDKDGNVVALSRPHSLVFTLADMFYVEDDLMEETLNIMYSDRADLNLPYCGDVSIGMAIVTCFSAKGYSRYELCTDVAEEIDTYTRSLNEGEKYKLGLGYTLFWKDE